MRLIRLRLWTPGHGPRTSSSNRKSSLLFRFILGCMKSYRQASAQARNQRRDGKTGRFLAESKPAPTAPLEDELPVANQKSSLICDPNRAVPVGGVIGPTSTRSRNLIQQTAKIEWGSSGELAAKIERCSSLEDVVWELECLRQENLKQIAACLADSASVVEPWEWDEEPLKPGDYVVTIGGEGDFAQEMAVSYRSFTGIDSETGFRLGAKREEFRLGIATVPEMFATWMDGNYGEWSESHPDHLDRKCGWWDNAGDIDAFREDAHQRWEENELGDPHAWAHYDRLYLSNQEAQAAAPSPTSG